MNIGKRFKKIRETLNLSQFEFASELGITQAYISKIEQGTEKPSEQLILAVCWRYCINKEWLIDGIGEAMTEISNCLRYILELYGEKKFSEALTKLNLNNGLISFPYEREFNDPELMNMMHYLKELWGTGDRDLQGWLKIQFKNAFPKYEEVSKKRVTTQSTPNGA